ncbi:Oidioi.mRNA.OKI2018_I69.chrUn_7.g17250.t1.cds [Oikopleura dioica]|uniref:Oidioi.mRNA.OKI2018_I69.chrUn_7.g17250.t1.c ds n=1 Tax=Oikopleura dioica TaxID=34765 RepID=A0ABN7T9V4_OIKDI|nr:Oidioi.mRNA.OKI2018_I69.chrUn_7.g17250.t1.cds [Oikopleura dioica]
MDESVKSVSTVLCNHSFHSQCLKIGRLHLPSLSIYANSVESGKLRASFAETLAAGDAHKSTLRSISRTHLRQSSLGLRSRLFRPSTGYERKLRENRRDEGQFERFGSKDSNRVIETLHCRVYSVQLEEQRKYWEEKLEVNGLCERSCPPPRKRLRSVTEKAVKAFTELQNERSMTRSMVETRTAQAHVFTSFLAARLRMSSNSI